MATGLLKSDRICWFQRIQIFCCTLARYQSPPVSVPSGTPGPGGPNSMPGVWLGVAGPLVAPDAFSGLPTRAGVGSGVFFLLFRASSSGSPFVGASSLGGFRILGASGTGAGASDGAGAGAVTGGACG